MRQKHLLVGFIFESLILSGLALAQDDPAMNPFFQPNETTIYYGSSDVNGDGQINVDDYSAMQSGTQNDMADIDGNGTPSTDNDLFILNQYLQGTRDYLPGHWNSLQTVGERESWLEAMLAIDPTDEIPYQTGVFISGDYRSVTEMNFAGRIDPADPNIPYGSEIINFARFNMPVYGVSIINPSTHWGNGMDAILTGENPLEWDSWSFVEPQLDDINVQPGSQSIPHNVLVGIDFLGGFQSNGNRINMPLVAFQIDENGPPSPYEVQGIYPNPDLITTRPSVAISNETQNRPLQLLLLQNYPNPFNPTTTIKYGLPERSDVTFIIHDLRGREIFSTEVRDKEAGWYELMWSGQDNYGSTVASGIYLTRMQAGSYSKVIKMLYLK